MIKAITIFVLMISIAATGYFGVQAYTRNPCSTPRTFSVSSVDPQFAISKETIEQYSKEAAESWNEEYDMNDVLTYVKTGGDIEITLVYDERQRTTIENERLKRTIEEGKNELNDLKQTIESLRAEHASLEDEVGKRTKTYNANLAKYNAEVDYWNSKGGAPTETYKRLQREQAELETERARLNASISRFNALADRIREYGDSHNEVVSTINEKIFTLNETAVREFEEGTYDPNTDTITIYEFASHTALKRVLMHELGHALRLDHVEDEEAIMFPINQSKSLALSDADRLELSRVCRERTAGDLIAQVKAIRDDISLLVKSSLLYRFAPQG